MLRVMFASVLMLMTVETAWAQAAAAPQSWTPEVGGEIRVTGRGGDRTTGQLRGLDAETMRLLVGGQEVVVARDAVARIERRGDSVRNGFIIGAVLGILPAALATAEVDGGANRAFAVVAGSGIYGLIGMGIDAARNGWTTVYEGKAAPTSARRRQFWIRPTASGMHVGYTRRF